MGEILDPPAAGDSTARAREPVDLDVEGLSAACRGSHAGPHEPVTFICTGAFLLAATGALDGRPATTHWEDQEELAQRWPDIQVRTDVRWVDDGDIVTSAGISASLHIVGRLFGWQLARRTALQMEYDWTGEHTAEAGI
ncbi:DJ-1/PfpI family protein [Streptomyces sp. NBC_00272]|uniref:DJ-1/PfpI family protein n=1 Tax=Streptomyces sp. NBC_00272 TaxID=2975698 RepID=UPI002E2C8985|nr:DJ-1/PfpI family protein [Streptomyces sp. NBC_00272]WSR23504.1 DJ-1/PfpI family protein [Streptomyces sp. NBC_01205]